MLEQEDSERTVTRPSRRRLLRRTLEGAGFLAFAGSGAFAIHQATAKDDDDDDDGDNSGRGSGGGDDDRSGRGGGGDEDDVPVALGQVPAGSIEIRIVDDDANGFSPGNLTVDTGQSVTFVNADDDPHTATGSGFDTGIIQPGGVATVVLEQPGTFAYACQIHPVMTGSIAVRGADGEVPAPAESTPPAGATTVQIRDFAFDSASLTIPVGTTVAWTNADAAPHTVTALDGAFDSGILDPGGGFAWEFSAPGTFPYRCDLHPQMEGSVEVTGAAVAQEAPPAGTSDDATPTGVGSIGTWLVTLLPVPDADLAQQRALLTLHADGTLDVVYAPAETDGRLPFTLSPGHGAWEDDGESGFQLTAVTFLLDAEGRFAGTLTVREEGHLDDTGDAYQGSFTFEAIGVEGEVIAGGDGTTDGERVRADGDAPTLQATPAAGVEEASAATVTIRDFAFDPPTLEVPAGTTLTWTNAGAAPHTASAEDGSFDTGRLDAGQEGSHTFAQPGTYVYFCDFHPEMQGTVVVA